MKLGVVTYLWGADWDLPTLIKNCEVTQFEGVELRSTHKHGVEVTLTKSERADVKKRFADSPVELVGLGSACEYHSADHAVLEQNIELTKEFVKLSSEVGSSGIKVRPNGFVKGEERKTTIERMGKALNVCGKFASDYNQQIRVEVHGHGTKDPAVMKEIMDIADHPNVTICWNANPGETIDGSIEYYFNLLKDRFGQTVHIHDLFDKEYPYRQLFRLLQNMNYKGYCLSESPRTADPIRVMHYYKALWDELIKPERL